MSNDEKKTLETQVTELTYALRAQALALGATANSVDMLAKVLRGMEAAARDQLKRATGNDYTDDDKTESHDPDKN